MNVRKIDCSFYVSDQLYADDVQEYDANGVSNSPWHGI